MSTDNFEAVLMAAIGLGAPLMLRRSRPKQPKQKTEADLQRIAAAEAKRERRAAKRRG